MEYKKIVLPLLICCLFVNQYCYSEEVAELAIEKDGLHLSLRFAEPLDFNNSELICEIVNTTDENVIFELRGSFDRPPLVLHLFDSDGREIEKTAEWMRVNENGFQAHTREGIISKGDRPYRFKIDLEKAFGNQWKEGNRLDVIWNADEVRSGRGPSNAVFGLGRGMKGSLNINREEAIHTKDVFAEDSHLPSEVGSQQQTDRIPDPPLVSKKSSTSERNPSKEIDEGFDQSWKIPTILGLLFLLVTASIARVFLKKGRKP